MVGLVFVDECHLTPVQWAAIALHAGGWLWSVHSGWIWQADNACRRWWLSTLVLLSGLWAAFWNQTTSIDQWLLFGQAQYLSQFGWIHPLG